MVKHSVCNTLTSLLCPLFTIVCALWVRSCGANLPTQAMWRESCCFTALQLDCLLKQSATSTKCQMTRMMMTVLARPIRRALISFPQYAVCLPINKYLTFPISSKRWAAFALWWWIRYLVLYTVLLSLWPMAISNIFRRNAIAFRLVPHDGGLLVRQHYATVPFMPLDNASFYS